MQIFLRILKETGIAIVALGIVALVVWLLFQNQLPFLNQSVPSAVDYVQINKSEFDVAGGEEGGIETEFNPKQTYVATNEQLSGYIEDRYISTGLINPFSSESTSPDVPSERVTIKNPTVLGTDTAEGETEEGATDSGTKSLE